MLRGSAVAKIDDKGRLKVPSIFRSVIETSYGHEFFVTSTNGESALLYPLPVYAEIEQRLASGSSLDPAVRHFRSLLNYYGQPATMDGQGRILVHPQLREKGSLGGEVAVLGQQNHLEVWNHGLFKKQLGGDALSPEEIERLVSLGF